MKKITIIAYLATIPIANWLINNVGTQFAPDANTPRLVRMMTSGTQPTLFNN